MGIICKIRVHRPPNGRFTPNGIVSGVINYSVDKPLSIKTITVSLKGTGRLQITEKSKDKTTYHIATEQYVYIENNIQEKQDENVIPSGSYQIPFKFILPEDIPATLDYGNLIQNISCRIVYNIGIHFARPGRLSFDKKFQQEIVVVRDKLPISNQRYPTELMVYGERKKLFHIFKNNIIKIKVKMLNSFIPPGGTVNLEYEVSNDSDIQIKGVDSKMIEVYTFSTQYRVEKRYKDIPNTRIRAGAIAAKQTQNIPLSFTLPANVESFECSKIVCRDYAIFFTVEVPGPHRNLELTVPFQVGIKRGDENTADNLEPNYDYYDSDEDDELPSYWEAMGEYDDKDA